MFSFPQYNHVKPQSKERVQQIHEKIARKQQISGEESAIMVEWSRQQDRANEIEDEKKASANQKEIDSRHRLQDQVRSIFSL